MGTYRRKIKIYIPVKSYWMGLSRQELAFHQAIGELIDNCLSAAKDKDTGERMPFYIEISIERMGSIIMITIIDKGHGIAESDLIENIFNPGGITNNKGVLNEHGFGLKNALCVLSASNTNDWKVVTRDSEAFKKGRVYRVTGPFSDDMKLEICDESDLNPDEALKFNDTGTCIDVTTSFDYFSTTYNRSKKFSDLIERLIEHLGVMYRKFLEEKDSTLTLRWKDSSDKNSVWNSHVIKPIYIHYDGEGSTTYNMKIPGPNGDVEVKYTVGRLDREKTCMAETYKPYPLKIYYQGNQKTQGVDIIVNGRLIQSGVLTKIWTLPRHNDHNLFVGEIIINDERFKTTNNKIGLDPNNIYTVNLIEELRSDEKYKIERITKNPSHTIIKEKLLKVLNVMNKDGFVSKEHSIWSGSGVFIDIYTKDRHDEITIFEIKNTVANPISVYQLLMYWDGVVKDENKSPSMAILVALEIPEKIKLMMKDINNRVDAMGNPYFLVASTTEELGVDT